MSRDEVRKYLDNMEAIKEYKVIKSENQRQELKIQSLERKNQELDQKLVRLENLRIKYSKNGYSLEEMDQMIINASQDYTHNLMETEALFFLPYQPESLSHCPCVHIRT